MVDMRTGEGMKRREAMQVGEDMPRRVGLARRTLSEPRGCGTGEEWSKYSRQHKGATQIESRIRKNNSRYLIGVMRTLAGKREEVMQWIELRMRGGAYMLGYVGKSKGVTAESTGVLEESEQEPQGLNLMQIRQKWEALRAEGTLADGTATYTELGLVVFPKGITRLRLAVFPKGIAGASTSFVGWSIIRRRRVARSETDERPWRVKGRKCQERIVSRETESHESETGQRRWRVKGRNSGKRDEESGER
ncbi:hypothetical protein JB92DRAFT_2830428 [Gautieria morchelliformis]|nr:hypothetical protein JB92DRAFT_2830428 [Gautieria morchelliformis]